MTGNPVLQQEKTVIKGCKVTIQVDENRGKVEHCTAENSGRVTAVIHPQKKK
jgi:lipopolysaccharide export system protein LptA